MKRNFFSRWFAIGMIAAALVMTSCSKDDNEGETPKPEKPLGGAVINKEAAKDGYMIFITSRNKGEKIYFGIDAKKEDQANVWVDLNNNGQKEEGEDVSPDTFGSEKHFKVDSQTIVVYGKVTEINDVDSEFLVTAADIRHNPDLEVFSFESSENFEPVDISKNLNLKELYFESKKLTSLDVSKHVKLETLSVANANLTILDVSKNTELMYLYTEGNKNLTKLDVSKNTKLKGLYCKDNGLTSLDVSHNTALEYLNCVGNKLKSLDVSNNKALEDLDCYNNGLKELVIGEKTALNSLDCQENQLTALDLSGVSGEKLPSITCYKNQIKEENMSNFIKSLPDRNGKPWKSITIVSDIDTPDGNSLPTSRDIKLANGKRYSLYKRTADNKFVRLTP
ncbi:leucine-rich repeat domain-containing protein [Capnocytophaga canimorsus]|uniref:leucine-rich repeat domain-containing protein n=1 Tax=Capnocytophaga canimorsus TaxID=28188 RepID=UPI00385B599D